MTADSPGARAQLAQKVSVPIVIHFPWNAAAAKFAREKIYFDTAEFTKQLNDEN